MVGVAETSSHGSEAAGESPGEEDRPRLLRGVIPCSGSPRVGKIEAVRIRSRPYRSESARERSGHRGNLWTDDSSRDDRGILVATSRPRSGPVQAVVARVTPTAQSRLAPRP